MSEDGWSSMCHDRLYGNYQWMAVKIAEHEAKHIDRWSSKKPGLLVTVGPRDDSLLKVGTGR